MTVPAVELELAPPPRKADIVNVASVPQRSPFRYPGGKTWLVPKLRRWLGSAPARPAVFVEPFAGGATCSLTAAFERLAEEVVMVELDESVAAVWETVLGGGAEDLARRILSFRLTGDTVREELAREPADAGERAFQTVLRNRVNRGGILAPGAGLIKEGENGKGLRSRWYPETLARRIRDIDRVKDRITFVKGDGLEVMRRYAGRADAVFLVDPPYTAGGKSAGARLYAHNALDHGALFSLCGTVRGDFLMTYDNAAEVRGLAERHGFDTEAVAMKNTHHAEMNELLIGRDLSWVRG